MRGGTLKGAYFLRENLPADEAEMNQVLLSVIGSSHELQKNGLGGGRGQTSKLLFSIWGLFQVRFKNNNKYTIR